MVRKVIVAIVAASAVPLCLVLRRGAARGSIWQPVTGRVEEGESLVRAARREVQEETGARYGRLIELRKVHRFGRDGTFFEEHAFALVVPQPFVPTLSREHVAWRWAALHDAVRLVRWPKNREVVRRAAGHLLPRPGTGAAGP